MNGTTQRRVAIRKHIGRKVRAAREAAGLTQRQLADAIGLRQPEISNIEKGKRGLPSDRVAAVARVCDVSIESLFPTFSAPPER